MSEAIKRRDYLGATDIAAIYGLHPYRSPMQVAMEKRGLSVPQPTTEAMQRGIDLEQYVAGLASNACGERLVKAPFVRHHGYPFLAATPDYISLDTRQLHEIKTHLTWLRDQYGPDETDVPAHEAVQCLWQMHLLVRDGQCRDTAVLDVAFVDSNARLYRGNDGLTVPLGVVDYQRYTIPYDEPLATQIEEFAVEWWNRHVVHGEDVEPTALDATTIRELYPRSTPETVEAPSPLLPVIRKLRRTKQAIAKLQEIDAECTARIQQFMKTAERMTTQYGDFTWTTVCPRPSMKADLEKLKAEFPEAYAACVHEEPRQTYRRFTTPRTWKEK